MEPRQRATTPTMVRLTPESRERLRMAAAKHFQGNESMLLRDAVEIYLDLRDNLGFDFDRKVQPLRDRELAAAS